jgi:hypothetical protein
LSDQENPHSAEPCLCRFLHLIKCRSSCIFKVCFPLPPTVAITTSATCLTTVLVDGLLRRCIRKMDVQISGVWVVSNDRACGCNFTTATTLHTEGGNSSKVLHVNHCLQLTSDREMFVFKPDMPRNWDCRIFVSPSFLCWRSLILTRPWECEFGMMLC